MGRGRHRLRWPPSAVATIVAGTCSLLLFLPPASPQQFGVEEELLINQMRAQLDVVHSLFDDYGEQPRPAEDGDSTPPPAPPGPVNAAEEDRSGSQPIGEPKKRKGNRLAAAAEPVLSFDENEDKGSTDVYIGQEMGDSVDPAAPVVIGRKVETPSSRRYAARTAAVARDRAAAGLSASGHTAGQLGSYFRE